MAGSETSVALMACCVCVCVGGGGGAGTHGCMGMSEKQATGRRGSAGVTEGLERGCDQGGEWRELGAGLGCALLDPRS